MLRVHPRRNGTPSAAERLLLHGKSPVKAEKRKQNRNNGKKSGLSAWSGARKLNILITHLTSGDGCSSSFCSSSGSGGSLCASGAGHSTNAPLQAWPMV